MPYITCDGKTYSRYDNSPYVKNCIEKEQAYYDSIYKACTLDPHCRQQRERTNHMINCIAIISLIFIIWFVARLINIISK